MHEFPIRVYYEDTDAGGIVYYANYLKFIERARSEWVRHCGIDQRQLRTEQGLSFVVRRVEADYLRPALYDDQLRVVTSLASLGGARIDLLQDVFRDAERLFLAKVTLVCIGAQGAVRLPEAVRSALR
jgi:acyl-CoA thioester hydrolase